MKSKEYICVLCPNSCSIQVSAEGNRVLEVRGCQCKRGKEWAVNETIEPRRYFVGSVTVEDGEFGTVSVKSSTFIPLEKAKEIGLYTHRLRAKAPIRMHQVVDSDILGLKGVNLIATREVRKNR